jgi:1-acyl-sn-glycerol-3-phosphate acyltransferase
VIKFRSALLTIAFLLACAVTCVLMIPLFAAPRRWVMAGIKVWARVVTWLAWAICGIRTEVRGREHLPQGAALIAGKHQSLYDTCAPFVFLPDICYVLKKELVTIPLFGWYTLKGGMIVVDRDAGSTALRKLVDDSKDRLRHTRQIMIFPEGTRTKPGDKASYKPGIAALYRELDMPCIPMATNSGMHWPNKNWIRTPGTIVFEFLAPIPPGLKRGEFMRELEERIETASRALYAE